MKKKNGFTIVELIIVIGLLVVIAGLFSVNMIKVMNKNREDEIQNVKTQLIAAADAYVSMNPSEVQDLYDGYGYVEIPVGTLRKFGLVNEDMKDPRTGDVIPDDKIVRVRLSTNGELEFDFNIDTDSIGWNLEYGDIILHVDNSGGNWCDIKSNPLQGVTLKNNKNEPVTNENISNAQITVTSCNVNSNKVGTYHITYSFRNPNTGTTIRNKTRNVYVLGSNDDVISFSARITNKDYDYGKKIPQGANDVVIEITEKTKNSKKSPESFILSGNYEVLNLSTEKTGDFKATIRRTKANTDGTIPSPVTIDYKIVSTTVTFDAMGGTPSKSTKNVKMNETYGTLPTVSKKGYIFTGWYTSSTGGKKVTESTTVNTVGDHTLYAHWISDQVEYKVYHYLQNVDGTYPSSTPYVDTDKATYGTRIYPRTRSFGGFTAPSKGYIDLTLENNSLTYKYTRNKNKITINLNGGTYRGSTIPSEMYYEATLYLGTPERSGYKFLGWTTTSGSIDDSSNVFKMSSSPATIAANWEVQKYTLTYNNNGGTGCTSKSVSHGSEWGELCTPTKYEYGFRGWYTSSGEEVTSSTIANQNTTVTAKWRREYTLISSEWGSTSGACDYVYNYKRSGYKPFTYNGHEGCTIDTDKSKTYILHTACFSHENHAGLTFDKSKRTYYSDGHPETYKECGYFDDFYYYSHTYEAHCSSVSSGNWTCGMACNCGHLTIACETVITCPE